MISIENIHDMAGAGDVKRFLIDHEWPKDVVRSIPHKEKSGGLHKALAQIHWSPELAPSVALWRWFNHDPEKIESFRKRYAVELEAKKKSWLAIAGESQKGEVVLLYHGRRGDITPAQFLKEFLEIQLKAHRVPKSVHEKCTCSSGLSGGGVAPPVEKAISRKHKLPLKTEMSFRPEQKLTQMPAEKRKR